MKHQFIQPSKGNKPPRQASMDAQTGTALSPEQDAGSEYQAPVATKGGFLVNGGPGRPKNLQKDADPLQVRNGQNIEGSDYRRTNIAPLPAAAPPIKPPVQQSGIFKMPLPSNKSGNASVPTVPNPRAQPASSGFLGKSGISTPFNQPGFATKKDFPNVPAAPTSPGITDFQGSPVMPAFPKGISLQSGPATPPQFPNRAPGNYFTHDANFNSAGTLERPGVYPNTPMYADAPMSRLISPNGQRFPTAKQRKRKRFPIWARVLVAVLAVFILLPSSGYLYYQINYADAVNHIVGQTAIHHTNASDMNGTGASTPQTSQQNNNGTLNGNRINILLLGSDNDGKGNDGISGSPLAQTDIVVTIDPQSHYVGMLSIPRDLQVTIPGHGAGKMDFAFSYGYQDGRSQDIQKNLASAAGLAEDTILYNYGIKVDYYAWVGLSGFIKIIDTAGGVDVDVIHPMVDDNYPDDAQKTGNDIYGYKRVYIAPGPQHLNGIQALEYVRTRHSDLVGDFGRSVRQQQVLTQLKTKLATPDILTQAPALLRDMKGAVQTDLDIPTLSRMATFARSLNTNNIDRITLSPPTYSQSGLAGGNFAPVCSTIKGAIAKMFAIQPKCILQEGQIEENTTTFVAITQPLSITASTGPLANTIWQSPGQITTSDAKIMSASAPETVHNLLDLMFLVVFGSFNATKV